MRISDWSSDVCSSDLTCGFDSIRRMVQSSRAFGENFAARFRNPDAVFELGRQRSIAGDGGPSVLQHLHAGLADIDHRLDGEEHAGLQFRTVARAADMHRSEEHTSELQSIMRISFAVFSLK